MTLKALHAIRGLTPEKCTLYGPDLIQIVRNFDPKDSKPPPAKPAPFAPLKRKRSPAPKPVWERKATLRSHTAPQPAQSSAPEDQIYILELAGGRVYVGRTGDMRRRIAQHMSGKGSAFTQAFAPTGTLLPRLGRVSGSAEAAERDETLRYMFLRGISHVRGWKYTRVGMSDDEQQDAEANIRELYNLCRRCGHKGHFVSQCRGAFDRLGTPCRD